MTIHAVMDSEIPKVYYGGVIPSRVHTAASLACKADKIVELLDFSTIEPRDKVAIKMHLGFKDGYQTVPVFFVRRVVDAVKKAGGWPFITDNPTSVYNAVNRGYTQETCGCPLVPIAGIKDGYKVETPINFGNVEALDMCGAMHDADVLINLSHSKGHGCCGYGGAIKNIAIGAYVAKSRWRKIHSVEQSFPYWDGEKCSPEHAKKLAASCSYNAIGYDEEKHDLRIGFCLCNQCGDCLEADKDVGCLQIKQENFQAFQDLMALTAKKVTDTFDSKKLFYLNYALEITPTCDCYGIGQPAVVNDVGIFGSKDIVAIEMATLDAIGRQPLIEANIPPYYRHTHLNAEEDLHPFQRIHGPMKSPYLSVLHAAKLGMGSKKYELIEVLPPSDFKDFDSSQYEFEDEPTFF